MTEKKEYPKWEAISEKDPLGATFSSEGVSKQQQEKLDEQIDLCARVAAERETNK